MAPLRIAVIGVGHLGKEHARILAGLPQAQLVGVVDVNAEQAEAVARRCGVPSFTSFWPLLNLVDAATVAVPTSQHHAIAGEFLRRGIPLMVEKPLAATLAQAEELVELARAHAALLQVGHIERFNPAFEELHRRTLQPKFIEVERLGPYTGRSTDIGVVLDLMIHDLDLLLALLKAPVLSVQAIGATVFGGQEDLVNARLTFANGCVANLTASRISPQPRRQMRLWSPAGYVGLDFIKRRVRFIQPCDPMMSGGSPLPQPDPRPQDHGIGEFLHGRVQTLDLDLGGKDQLTCELQSFIESVQAGSRPRVSGADGRDAIGLATRILERMRLHRWTGQADGPSPQQLRQPLGHLFQPFEGGAAA